ncbi:hypothetical protein [Peterkaempfera griseoplana]|uniref:hypothetical protein n=1 Tax=Peterkaempfera griseoplana TaxID=66896 RepID=UPI0006E3F644|nr:hypothetical protein [Peterkaempfera griseoplana]
MTADSPAPVPDWPCPTVRITADGRVEADGITVPVPEGIGPDGVLGWAAAHTARQYERIGRAIRVTAVEPDGTRRPLIVHLDGTVVHPDGTPLRALGPEPAGSSGRILRPVGRPEGVVRRTSRTQGLAGAAFLVSGALGLALVALVVTSGGHHPGQASQAPAFQPRTTPPSPYLSEPGAPPVHLPETEPTPAPATTPAQDTEPDPAQAGPAGDTGPDPDPSVAPAPRPAGVRPPGGARWIPGVPHHAAREHHAPPRLRFHIPQDAKGFRFEVPKGSCHALARQGGLPGGLFTACRSIFG